VKKFSLMIVAAIVVVAAWSSTASAQCGNGRFFGGYRGGNGCGVFGGGGLFHRGYSCAPTYYSYPSCNSGGYVVIPSESYQKKAMPSPAYTPPYEGTPKTTEPLPVPPKKIQPPSFKQEGFPGASIQTININGYAYGRLPDGSYAKISDGTYARLTGYGSK